MATEADFAELPEAGYVRLPLTPLSKKSVERKNDGKKFTILLARDDQGREVSLFDFALKKRADGWWVRKDHLERQIAEAKTPGA